MDLIDMIKGKEIKNLSKDLNVSPGTIKRWLHNNNIPRNYVFDILRLNKYDIDYTNYNYKDKDQFYTPVDTAKHCYNIVKNKIKNTEDYIFIEPSAGDGAFLTPLSNEKYIAFDIEPRHINIQKQDYLQWKDYDLTKKYIVIGNPPFGLRGHTALNFINHSYIFADYVAFILPPLFDSDGKGTPKNRIKGYNVMYCEKIETDFVYPDGKKVIVNTVFQILSKFHTSIYKSVMPEDNINIFSISIGDKPSQIRNKHMIDKCDIYLPSTCYGSDNMKTYKTFHELPNKRGYGITFTTDKAKNISIMKSIDWKSVAHKSTNSSYNLRTSSIIRAYGVNL